MKIIDEAPDIWWKKKLLAERKELSTKKTKPKLKKSFKKKIKK